jgi:hypothetical protein
LKGAIKTELVIDEAMDMITNLSLEIVVGQEIHLPLSTL